MNLNERLSHTLTVTEETAGQRLDHFIADQVADLTRSQLVSRSADVRVNGEPAKMAKRVQPGDTVEVSYDVRHETLLQAEDLHLDVIYEDRSVIVINKPQGIVVHPGAGNRTGTLAHGLLYHVEELDDGSDRPGIVHRLDKDTSGVLVAAKDTATLEFLTSQFRSRTVEKEYRAIVKSAPPKSVGNVSANIARDRRNRKRFTAVRAGGKEALTEYRVVKRYRGYTYVSVHPLTGRTHQIRVHLKHIGCPVLGDPVYGRPDKAFPAATLMLHAYKLSVVIPGEQEARVFCAQVPERFTATLLALGDLPSEGFSAQ